MYGAHVARAAERWRRLHGGAVRGWVDAVGELEALLCLATYSYEHPDDPFPELAGGAPDFEGTAVAHPLIPAGRRVCNDVAFGGGTRVLLISGSNMSGKSTLLRTVGINTVLAMAGAPVCARALRLTPLQLGASIRVNDSLQEGSSRFYAEISRIRQLFDAAGTGQGDGAGPGDGPGRSLLFLLDELLQGTNSADRRVGAEGIVRAFVERGAIGLVSTHDLALTDLRGLPPGCLRNLHFEDEMTDGRMSFDYRLREGVVTRSNAVALMRAVGLEV
jgi:DNA mismatch repair ATPase MutS